MNDLIAGIVVVCTLGITGLFAVSALGIGIMIMIKEFIEDHWG